MAKSQLHFLGHIVDLLTVETVYNKDFNKYKGTSMPYNKGGLLKFVFDFEAKFRFLERMKTVNYDLYKRGYPIDDGKIVFYDANGDNLKTWKFKDAPIVYYKVKFDTNGGGMRVEMIISPAIQDYGCKIHRSWHITPIEEESYQSPVYAIEEEEKKPKIIKSFFENTKTLEKINTLKAEMDVNLVINFKQMDSKKINIDLSKYKVDFQYQETKIENNILKNILISGKTKKVSLRTIKKQ